MPEITVLLAVHNGGRYLEEAVNSVLAQTYDDFELLIVDDASTDGAVEALPGDPRARVLRNARNLGQVPSLNLGLQEARGRVVARLDADDVCTPERLERQLGMLDASPGVGLVGAWMQLVDAHDRPIGNVAGTIDGLVDFVYWTLVQYVLIPHPAAMYLREPVLELGAYDETMGPAEDKDLWRRLLLSGWDARIVPETLVRYRVHDEQLSQTRSGLQRANDDRSQEAFLAELCAPDAPVGVLRQLLAGDLAVWDGLDPATDLRPALDDLLERARERFELSDVDAAVLADRVRRRVEEVVRSGWRVDGAAWRAQGELLVAWAVPTESAGLGVRAVAAPALRLGQATVGGTVVRLNRLSALARLRALLRRNQALRKLYAYVTRAR